jgi:phosphatidylserine/phosphatidylglycerophosphate/cardiolipin synthase-like enzyme
VDREETQDEVKLLIQPGDGVAPVVRAIHKAKKTIDIVIFRFDRAEVEKALDGAVDRGVVVRALIAHTNKGGEKNLRKLELRLLACGATVARTADDLARYHGKMMIVDGAALHVYGFNYTKLDIEHSRSFGVVTRDKKIVREAQQLFDADALRQSYTPTHPRLVVSPENSRAVLTAFIKGARKELLIYDACVSDNAIQKVLAERANAGVKIRILGGMEKPNPDIKVRRLAMMRLHVRAIIRDGRTAFIGSQSLRKLELEGRREVGIIIQNGGIVRKIAAVFESDWEKNRKKADAQAS